MNLRDWTIVFDLDGTFVDTAPDLIGATNHALADLALPPVAGKRLRPWISFGARRMISEALAISNDTRSDAEVDRLLELFLTYYEANISRESRPFAGAVESAEALKAAGARLAVCTNKREGLSLQLLGELKLMPLFSAIAGRDTFPVHKPHPDHLLGTIRLAGGEAARAIMIGDSDVDVDTARAANVPVIGATFGYCETPMRDIGPSETFDRYAELESAIATVVAASLRT